MNQQYLTHEGMTQLQTKLQELKTNRRREIAEAIQTAKEQGDLSENAEYQQAKDEQRRIEMEIGEIESTLKNAEVIKKSSSEQVNVGNTVTLDCNGDKKEYQIVGSNEANPMEGKISNESPVGRALLNKKKGDTISIPTPLGEQECKILNIA